jgi:hypothetical protein
MTVCYVARGWSHSRGIFAASLSSAAVETLGVSQSLLRNVVVFPIASDVIDRLRCRRTGRPAAARDGGVLRR